MYKVNTHIDTTIVASNAEPSATRNIPIGAIPVLGQPSMLLRIEGLVLLAGSLLLYAQNRGEWVAFLALLLVPDLSMLGYLRGPAGRRGCRPPQRTDTRHGAAGELRAVEYVRDGGA